MDMKSCWFGLVLVKFLWTALPQAGYIHPDEFFQSVEVAAGDILDLKVVRTWEFNSTLPLRSIVPIYVIAGVPLMMLKVISMVCGFTVSWYSVTVSVRLSMTLLSLVTDVTAMKLARWLGYDGLTAVILSSSYVSLVYFTRTFSNTLEAFVFATLLYVVISSSSKLFIDAGSEFVESICICTLIVFGVFNRPTFIAYAAVPYLYWLTTDGMDRLVPKIVNSVTAAVPVATLIVMCDSLYFSEIHLTHVTADELAAVLTQWTRYLTITPINFIRYNLQSENLAEHGIHPRLTHVAVNLPLLFSVLGLLLIYNILSCLITAIVHRKRPTVSNKWIILCLCCVVPVALLSIFPHQEPRFLIPLLTVLAAMFGHRVLSSRWVVLWVIWNVVGCIFYGSMHQAGVVPCLGHLQRTVSSAGPRHVVFWHTYTAPHHLLLIGQRTSPTSTVTSIKNLEGSSIDTLLYYLLLMNSSKIPPEYEGKPEVMVASSSSEHYRLVCAAAKAGFGLELDRSFWPHVSTEHLPRLDDVMCDVTVHDGCYEATAECANNSLLTQLKFLTSLHLYKVIF